MIGAFPKQYWLFFWFFKIGRSTRDKIYTDIHAHTSKKSLIRVAEEAFAKSKQFRGEKK